jgi:hypothetical protein
MRERTNLCARRASFAARCGSTSKGSSDRLAVGASPGWRLIFCRKNIPRFSATSSIPRFAECSYGTDTGLFPRPLARLDSASSPGFFGTLPGRRCFVRGNRLRAREHTMTRADEFRNNAEESRLQAERSRNSLNKELAQDPALWLEMAQEADEGGQGNDR